LTQAKYICARDLGIMFTSQMNVEPGALLLALLA
jgi:hypothetical protein